MMIVIPILLVTGHDRRAQPLALLARALVLPARGHVRLAKDLDRQLTDTASLVMGTIIKIVEATTITTGECQTIIINATATVRLTEYTTAAVDTRLRMAMLTGTMDLASIGVVLMMVVARMLLMAAAIEEEPLRDLPRKAVDNLLTTKSETTDTTATLYTTTIPRRL